MPAHDRTFVVDGETFVVHVRESGQHDFAWVSGPNRGYGYSSSCSPRTPLSDDEIVADVCSFLALVDPDTGYVED